MKSGRRDRGVWGRVAEVGKGEVVGSIVFHGKPIYPICE